MTASPDPKPDHLTALRGCELVPKDHPVIVLRGQLDALEAQILQAQVVLRRLGMEGGVAGLGEVLDYVKAVMSAEVRQRPLPPMPLAGLDGDELRDRSHHPKATYGIGHFEPSIEDGEAVIVLNVLRTAARQAELAAYAAFKVPGEQHTTRPDIIQAMNRLSSALYVMMFEAKTGRLG
ncbi:MAG: hypothetical protein LBH48_04250 [Bifidobacteriaceae bacterium]|jgi:ethanolamine utilization cobalamin adenosyltransferase|nr:hypothetical protein [Bifidobacteriaceae bacterium]